MDRNEILRTLMPQRTKQVALAWSILHESQLAEDAYQDMLAKVLENESIFEGPRHLKDWSWKVLRHRCYKLQSQQKYRHVSLDESVLECVDAELEDRDNDDIAERTNALHECLASLTANSRDIIRLRYFDGMQGKEVAETLGRKPDAVYKALQRIYASLAACIHTKLVKTETGDSCS